MSHSYKKNPGFHDGEGSKYPKFAKRFANRKVRHYKDLPNGNAYRKVSDSWDIHDYNFRYWHRNDLMDWDTWRGLNGKYPCWKELCKTEKYREARAK